MVPLFHCFFRGSEQGYYSKWSDTPKDTGDEYQQTRDYLCIGTPDKRGYYGPKSPLCRCNNPYYHDTHAPCMHRCPAACSLCVEIPGEGRKTRTGHNPLPWSRVRRNPEPGRGIFFCFSLSFPGPFRHARYRYGSKSPSSLCTDQRCPGDGHQHCR